MITNLHTPAPPLDRYIDHFFYYRGYDPGHEMDRFLPDGNIYLVFDLTEQPKFIYDNLSLEEIQTCRKVWFSGFRTIPITIPSGRESEMLVVNFRKGRAVPFLTEPLHALTNLVVDGELVLTKAILGLRDQIQEATDLERKFELLEKGLLALYASEVINPAIEYLVERIIAHPDQIHLTALTGKIGYSQKHLIKLFKDQVGITPKVFLKIMRFQRALVQIESKLDIQWTQVAHDCGFYDQSHFIADFKAFSGWTPEAYLRQRSELLNYVPVG